MAIGCERKAAFFGDVRIGVERYVRDGRGRPDKKRIFLQMRFHHLQGSFPLPVLVRDRKRAISILCVRQ